MASHTSSLPSWPKSMSLPSTIGTLQPGCGCRKPDTASWHDAMYIGVHQITEADVEVRSVRKTQPADFDMIVAAILLNSRNVPPEVLPVNPDGVHKAEGRQLVRGAAGHLVVKRHALAIAAEDCAGNPAQAVRN